jgi:hypothetical protein
MKLPAILNTRAAMIAAGVLVGGAVLYFAVRKLAKAPGEAADDFNRGTPYASDRSGAVGTAVRTAANVANEASFGLFEWLGGKVGEGASWLLNSSYRNYDPNK